MLGVAAAVLVFALRLAGLIVGPVAFAIVLLGTLLLPGPVRFSDRFLLVIALAFGWLPLLGWVPGLSTAVDVPGLLLSLAVGVAVYYQLSRRPMWRMTVVAPRVAEYLALGAGAVVVLWWGTPFVRLDLSSRLQFLDAHGYDNASHFALLRSNIRLGSFVTVRRSLPGGALRLGWDYPQGVHQSWAQIVRLWDPHPSLDPHWLLNAYIAMLLLTGGLVVSTGCMAIARVCRRDALVGLPAMILVVGLVAVGMLWSTVFGGTPNYGISAIAAAVAVSLVVRPSTGPRLTFVMVAGFVLVCAYNWYPAAVFTIPALVSATIRLWGTITQPQRLKAGVVLAGVALAMIVPAAVSAHRGSSQLLQRGGFVGAPWWLVIASPVALLIFLLVRYPTRLDVTALLVLGAPAYLGLTVVAAGAVYTMVHHPGPGGTYYTQKIATLVAATSLVLLAIVLADEFASRRRRRPPQPRTIVVAISTLAALGALEIGGYVGPASSTLDPTNTAYGFALHQTVLTRRPIASASGGRLIAAANGARRLLARTHTSIDSWWYIGDCADFALPLSGQALSDTWFAVLAGDPSEEVQARAGSLWNCNSRTPYAEAAVIATRGPNPTVGNVHLVVDQAVARALIQRDQHWATPGVLWTPQQLAHFGKP